MQKLTTASLILALCIVPSAHAGLTQSLPQNGNFGVELAGIAGGNTPPASGTITLSSVPLTATFVKATLYASEVNNALGLDAVFNGTSLGVTGPFASDPQFITLYAYQWDVTPFMVPAVSSYTVTVGQNLGANQIAGIALVVIWQDVSAPNRTVTIVDGMQQVGDTGPETESVSITGLPGGASTVSVFTVSDDNGATGETVTYNAATIGGPLDQNLGINASLLVMNGSSVAGSNTLSITTGQDHMGWMVATVQNAGQPTPTTLTSWGRIKTLYR